MGDEALVSIEAMVSHIESNRSAAVSEKARITCDYQAANVHSALTFDVPFSRAREFFVGQRLSLRVFVAP